MFGLFRNKWFWIIWLIAALTGALIGFIGSEIRGRKIENAEVVKLEDHYKPDRLYITGIEDTALKERYLNFEKDTVYPKSLNFEIKTIKTDKEIYALEWSKDSSLVLVLRYNSEPTTSNPRWTETWVWEKHVKRINKKTPQQKINASQL